MDSTEAKSAVTAILWISYLLMLWFTMPTLGIWVIALAFILMLPLIVMNIMIWAGIAAFNGGEAEATQQRSDDMEKRKRENLDSVLRDLSDDDLIRLRERLQTGVIDDAVLYNNLVGDDGELLTDGQR